MAAMAALDGRMGRPVSTRGKGPNHSWSRHTMPVNPRRSGSGPTSILIRTGLDGCPDIPINGMLS